MLTEETIETRLRTQLPAALADVRPSPDLMNRLRQRHARPHTVAASMAVVAALAVGLGTIAVTRSADRASDSGHDLLLTRLPLAAPSGVPVITSTVGEELAEGTVRVGLYRDADVPTGPGAPREVDVAGRAGLLYEDTGSGAVRLVVRLTESPQRSLVLTGRGVPEDDILRMARSALEHND